MLLDVATRKVRKRSLVSKRLFFEHEYALPVSVWMEALVAPVYAELKWHIQAVILAGRGGLKPTQVVDSVSAFSDQLRYLI